MLAHAGTRNYDRTIIARNKLYTLARALALTGICINYTAQDCSVVASLEKMPGSRMLMLRIILLVLLATDELGSQPCSNPREVELGSTGSFPAKFYPSSLTCSFSGFDALSTILLNLKSPLPFYGNEYNKFAVS